MEWKSAKLGELANINYGYTAKASFEINGPKFLRITDIQNGSVNWSTVPSCEISGKDFAKHMLEADDIVFARTGATTGKSYLIKTVEKSVAASYLIRLRLKSDIVLPEFIHLFFQTAEYWSLVEAGSSGSAQGGFNASKLSNLEINFPPLQEQKRIVALLDTVFADLEQSRAKTEQNLKNARELFDSYLQQVFSQKGDGWESSTLTEIAENLDSKRIPITKKNRKEGEFPYYGASGIVDYIDKYIFDEDLLLVSEDGANLLARTYPIAFSASGKYWVNNHAHVLRFESSYLQKFIEYYLNSISLVPYVTGMAQPKLNQKSLNSIPVPKVELDIAEKLVSQLESLEKEVLKVEWIYKSKLASIDELKKSILQKAFSGELTQKV